MQKKQPARPKGITTLEAIGIPVALGLIILPEPITSAAGTIAGIGILTSILGRRAAQ
jgi:hypothetical protein